MDNKKKSIDPVGPKISPLPNAIIQNDPKNWTALHEAAATGDEKKLQVLLERNPDRAVQESNNGNTPLHEAAWRGFSRCVKLLCAPTNVVKAAAAAAAAESKEKKNKNSKTASAKNILASTFLDIQNNGGFTALHLAAQNGHNQSCRELLLAGADPDIKNNYGDTPLHTSCRYGHAGATRILISADCDPNKVNLNGDHPLHISCAMGRRKLTRLLLEADCDMTMKNAQGETPRDIAIRKHHIEIIDILNNPQRMRNRREKHNKQRSRKSSLPDPTDLNAITWSPYGCHYFPDPRSFPAPKLETLPKEPLKKGEQYYLDLAGHIRKGPIGVGNTCYCGPFFKHIEHKINCNRKSLRRYVHKTKESLDNKVQALAIRTNDQIEQLTRSVIADRIRCESRRMQLHRILKRGEPLRSTTETHQGRSKRQEQTDASISRSRSMEFIDRESAQSSAISNAKSCGGLLDETIIEVHHQSNELCSESEDETDIGGQQADGGAGSISVDSIDDHSEEEDIMEEYDIDFYKAAESLSKLLEKAKILNETKKEPDKGEDDIVDQQNTSTTTTTSVLQQPDDIVDDINGNKSINFDEELNYAAKVLQEKEGQVTNEGQRRYENISNVESFHEKSLAAAAAATAARRANVLGIPVQFNEGGHLLSCEASENPRMKFLSSLNRNDYTLQNVISALRKDRREIPPNQNQNHNQNQRDFKPANETDTISEDKLSYKDESSAFLAGNDYLPSPNRNRNSIHSAIKWNQPTTLCPPPSAVKEHECSTPELNDDPRVSGKIEKIEIKNSEIKLLKKPTTEQTEPVTKRNRVQELVARLQGKLSATQQILSHSRKKRATNNSNNERKVSQSESSEDEQNNHNEYKSSVQNASQQIDQTAAMHPIAARTVRTNGPMALQSPSSSDIAADKGAPPIGIPVHLPLNLPERIIPKDAYFHELPNRKRNPINVRMFSGGGAAIQSSSTTILQGDYVQKRAEPFEPSSHISILKNTRKYNNSNSMQQAPPQQIRIPKAPSSSSIHHSTTPIMGNYLETNLYAGYELAAIGNNFQPATQLHCAPAQNYTHYVERDISNDSGVSTHFYGGGGGGGGQLGPSPSLSPQTYYPSTERLQSPKSFLYSNEMVRPIHQMSHVVVDPSNGDFAMGNVSSLV